MSEAQTQTAPRRIRGMEVMTTADERSRILARMNTVMEKGWFMLGDEQVEFEKRWLAATGRSHVTLTNSETSGMEILFRYLGRKQQAGGNRVIFQANHFPSPAMAALRSGWSVGFVDIRRETMSPTVDQLQRLFSSLPFNALVVQWTGGFISPDAPAIASWCTRNGVILIEDAAHAAGAYGPSGTPAGAYGAYAFFSLAATKPLHTAYGGVMVSDNEELATFAFRSKNYGRTEMFQKGEYVLHGGNYQFSDIQAALGNVLFDTMPDRVKARLALGEILESYCLESGVEVLGGREPQGCKPNFYKFPVYLGTAERVESLRAHMKAADIELGSSVYDFVTADLDVFKTPAASSGEGVWDVPVTRAYAGAHTCLPMHNKLSPEDAHRVGKELVNWAVTQR